MNQPLNFFRNLLFIDVLFYVLFIISIIISYFFEKGYLSYTVTLINIAIGYKHVLVCKKHDLKVNKTFLIALLIILVSDILSFNYFTECYLGILICITLYFILNIIIVKPYMSKWQANKMFSVSVLLCFLLLGYLVYAVLDLLIDFIPEGQLIFTLTTTLSLLIYTLIFALIYINDQYDSAVLLLISGVLNFFQVALSPINEFFHFTNTFTALIIICHILSLYLFMTFISHTDPIKDRSKSTKYV
ncbi:hypothetical protein GCM10022271_21750 [Corallibacter vietnamensis]|uniref:YhhN-like protein n=2 Tax=Corallibacter vietnamensis TaxID=904130 RepID=A0ABP7HC44_9FLAO